jgi:hypothetical protein
LPRASVWLIRSALLSLVFGAALGGLILAAPDAWGVHWWRVHAELMLIGWCLQLAIGVAYWILPKHAAGPARGSERLAATMHPLLNTGLALSIAAWLSRSPGALLGTGRVLELLAVLAFALGAAPRIKRYGLGREAGGAKSPSA